MNLNDQYKISVAKELTQLAIQNNLIDKYEDESDTAKAICKFFTSIFNNLDSK